MMELNDDYKRHQTRIKEVCAGEESAPDHFIQVECGFKHTLLLNKKGQVFAFGNGLQG